jgi:hypothetical protein
MAKPKRYPRARSPLHAMFLSNQGLPVRKPLHNETIGPATPSRLIVMFRERYSFDDETTAKVLGLLNTAASGKAIKYGNRVAMIPGGHGRVVVQISRQRRNTNHSTGVIAPKASLNDDTPTARRQIATTVNGIAAVTGNHSCAQRNRNSSYCA